MDPIICSRDVRARQEAHRLGMLILLWRRRLGMTQYQLAYQSGVAQSYISDLESGSIDPRWSTVYKIVYGLGNLTIQEFLHGPCELYSCGVADADRKQGLH